MKTLITIAILALMAVSSNAQSKVDHLRLETRFDATGDWHDGDLSSPTSGFKARYLNFAMSGHLTESLTYSYRQRLNKNDSNSSFFDATDWLYLSYRKNAFEVSAGKQVVGIGGYEYDAAPIDLYACSEFWNNIPCYQLGVNVSFYLNDDADKLVFQTCQSPFDGMKNNTYAYNLMWYGNHGWYESIWSVNMIEMAKGNYINYIALGNKFDFAKCSLCVDLMHRTDSPSELFQDMSLMSILSYRPTHGLKAFVKYTFDYHDAEEKSDLDWCVMPGTSISLFSAGLEFFPVKGSEDVRLHWVASYSNGFNSNPAGGLMDGNFWMNLGLKWRINLK